MAKRKGILNSALKALLAGAETSAAVKIPATFISELASLPDKKQKVLAELSQEQFNALLTQSKLATINAASSAADAKQIKSLIKDLIETVDKLNTQLDKNNGAESKNKKPVKKKDKKANPKESFDVFLCHNSEEKPAVKEIGQALRTMGLRPWLDEWELRPGLPWQPELEKQIENIRAAAVFVGNSGIGPWQDMEQQAFIREFVNRKCPVIPVILQDCKKPPKLPVFLRGMKWVDFRKDDPDPMDELFWGITGEKPKRKAAKKPIIKQAVIQNIPFDPLGDLFKGRVDDFDRLKKQLEKFSGTAITQDQKHRIKAIHGLGGIGKTRLAVEYAWYALNKGLYDAVFFVNCGQERIEKARKGDSQQKHRRQMSAAERLYAQMAKLAIPELLDIDAYDKMPPEAAYHQVIKELQRRKDWLLVFDNVDDNDTANAIKNILTQLKDGKVIITSRLANWTGNIKPLELKKLSLQASIDYLIQKTEGKRPPDDSDTEKVKEVAEKLDGLPVALEQAAAYIIFQSISFEQYLKDFEDVKLKVLGFEAKKLSLADYPEPVLRTWALTEQKLDAHARAVLTISAFLSADDIPESLLLNQSQAVLAISGVLEGVGQEEFQSRLNGDGDLGAVRRALALLKSYSMISRKISDKKFSIHRLVQEVARVRLDDSHTELFAQLILRMIHNDCPDYQTAIKHNFSWHRAMDSHISAIIAFAKRLWRDISSIPKAVAGPLATQTNNLAEFYRDQARFYEAELFIQRALEIDEVSFGKDHPEVATALNNLANLYQDTNRLEKAEPLYKRALEIYEKAFGKEHPKVATALNNLAVLYKDTNRLEEAEPLHKRALEIDEASLGKDNPNVAIHLNNLAELYQATNRLEEAEPLYKRALEIDEASLGKDNPNVAIRLNNLAGLYQATNRLLEAESLMIRVLEIFKKAFGEEHPKVATALNNLAELFSATNRLKEAEPLYKRALEIDEKAFGKDHPNVATRLNNLAMLYKDTNRFSKAEPLHKRTLEIYEASFCKDHPYIATALNNLAELYSATNRLKEAEPMYKRALEIDEASLGKDHPNVAIRLNNLAGLYQDTNRLSKAEPLYKCALEIDEASLGKDHPNVARDLNNLAQLYQDTNRLKEAEPLMERALEIDEKAFGEDHPNVATDLSNLAILYYKTNRLKEAEPLMKYALKIYIQFTRRTGHEHPHLHNAINNYGNLLIEMGCSKDEVTTRLKRMGLEMIE